MSIASEFLLSIAASFIGVLLAAWVYHLTEDLRFKMNRRCKKK